MKINMYRKLPQRPTLRANQVDVWCWTIDQLTPLRYDWITLLSWHEKQRANRFASAQQRDNYVLTHGMVRYLLSRYLNQEPEDLPLTIDTFDRLTLHDSDIRIGFASAENVVTVALAHNIDVCLQVEAMTELPDLDKLARFMLNSAETTRYRTLHRRQKLPTFYNLWTRKSALAKVTNSSTQHLSQLNVWDNATFRGDKPKTILHVQSLTLMPHYSGAIAYRLPTS